MSPRLQWGLPETPRPRHPYRDTLILYGVLAILIVVIAWATDGAVGKAAVIAVFFFVVASIWSSYRWRSRLRAEAKEQRIKEAEL
jgi:membrane protein implicated in regulation of membrane protease activity